MVKGVGGPAGTGGGCSWQCWVILGRQDKVKVAGYTKMWLLFAFNRYTDERQTSRGGGCLDAM